MATHILFTDEIETFDVSKISDLNFSVSEYANFKGTEDECIEEGNRLIRSFKGVSEIEEIEKTHHLQGEKHFQIRIIVAIQQLLLKHPKDIPREELKQLYIDIENTYSGKYPNVKLSDL